MTQYEALALTLAIELPVVLGLARVLAVKCHPGRLVGIAAAASLVTHPLAWLLAGVGGATVSFWTRAAAVETAVVAAETLVYARALPTDWRRALGLAAAANLASFAIGLAVVGWL